MCYTVEMETTTKFTVTHVRATDAGVTRSPWPVAHDADTTARIVRDQAGQDARANIDRLGAEQPDGPLVIPYLTDPTQAVEVRVA